ncbi:MAG: hypothetical protein IPN61_11595 [Bacteroidetes bacterium]|nr:hypothetical protein [Bacteroidota bacterium]MBK9414036.1 hypothetical protein [Bacteroidota bacterium]
MEPQAYTIIGTISGLIVGGLVTNQLNKAHFKRTQKADISKLEIQRQAEVLHKMIIALSNIEASSRKLIFTAKQTVATGFSYFSHKIYWENVAKGEYGMFTYKSSSTPEEIKKQDELNRISYNSNIKDYQFQLADLIQYLTEFNSYLDGDDMIYSYVDQLESFNYNTYNNLEVRDSGSIKTFFENSNYDEPYDYTERELVKKILDEIILKVRNEVDDRSKVLLPFGDWKKILRQVPKINL